MPKRTIYKGATSQIEYICIYDAIGEPRTGLVYNTDDLICYYVRQMQNAVEVPLITQTATGAYSAGGFVEVSGNMPGLYRFDIPDACFASGAEKVIIEFSGSENTSICILEYDLVSYNPNDSVRLGLGAIPNVESGDPGSILTDVDEVADAVLSRDVDNVEDTAGKNSITGIVLQMRNASRDANGEELTIYQTDGSTVFDTLETTNYANAKPMQTITPVI